MTLDILAQDIAERCQKSERTRTGFTACCPAHKDHNPSLSITHTAERVLLHCHAGCAPQAIVEALGMAMSDLFAAPAQRTNGHRIIEQVYDYVDEHGQLLYQTVRFVPKDFRQRRPDPVRPGEYVWNIEGVDRVLFHLPQVMTAVARGETIYLCEGEKDVETLERLGVTATTNAQGGKYWHPSYGEVLRGATVVLVPDHDETGERSVTIRTQGLTGKVGKLIVVRLPDLPKKGDVTDWVNAGGTREKLEKLVTQAQMGTPQRPRAIRISARELLAKEFDPLTYVVEDILPAGCTVLAGKSKDGKSQMAYNLTVAVGCGGKALGKYAVQQGSVWYLALEDGERRAQARLKLQEAHTEPIPDAAQDKIHFTFWDAPRLSEGLEEDIIEWVQSTPDARLIIIDILEKVRPPRKRHGNAYEEDYQPTATLTRLAQEHNIAILVIHHANKLNPVDFRDSASGAMSLLGGADNFWSLHRQPMSEEATLKVTGRDIINEQELAMQFKDGYWTVLGESNMVRMSAERRSIVDMLWSSHRPMTPKQLATATGKNASTVRTLLSKLVTQGVLFQPIEGRYTLTPTYRLSQERERGVDSVDSVDSVDAVDAVDSSGDSGSVSTAVYGSGEGCRQPQPIENIDSYSPLSTLSTVSTVSTHNTTTDTTGATVGNALAPDHVRCPVAGTHKRLKMGQEWRCSACNILMTPPLAKEEIGDCERPAGPGWGV